MSINRTDDAVAEYLHELELRLTGLPVLQRRELLAEIEAHISSERVERGVTSESELLELLERLGSPEVVAAAAYEEAGMLSPREPALAYAGPARASRPLPAVAPPPDSPPPAYAGPFPPASAFTPPSYAPFDGPPPAAGPPFAPPPVRKQDSGTGLRVLVGIAIAAVVVVLLGCLAGGMLLTRGATSDGSAVSVEPPEATQFGPAGTEFPQPPELVDPPEPTVE
jgi:hypothetical protein